MLHLSIDDITILVRRSRRTHYPSLKNRSSPPYGVELVVPDDCHDLEDFEPFVRKYLPWIKSHQQNAPMPLPFVEGMRITIEDQACVIVQVDSLKTMPYVTDNTLFVGGKTAHLNRRVQDYLRTRAKTRLACKIEYYCEKLGVTHSGLLRVRDMNTRWGSCNVKNGNITLNWRLILAPNYVFDHVVAHEVVHLQVPGHGKDFYHALHRLDPHTKASRHWLKKNGSRLFLYGHS